MIGVEEDGGHESNSYSLIKNIKVQIKEQLTLNDDHPCFITFWKG